VRPSVPRDFAININDDVVMVLTVPRQTAPIVDDGVQMVAIVRLQSYRHHATQFAMGFVSVEYCHNDVLAANVLYKYYESEGEDCIVNSDGGVNNEA